MQGPSARDAEAAPHKRPGSARSRKATPRARPKKESKKAATPRRRASPRNARKAADPEPETQQQETPPESAPEVKEEEQQDKTEEKAETQEAEAADKTETQQQAEELPLGQDTQLRRNYLQRIYRQLQSTHPNQGDAMIRQIATNVEMEVCQAAKTRAQYTAAMDQEINKLMQFEMEQANAAVYTNNSQNFQNERPRGQAQPAVSSEMQGGFSQNQISQSRSYEYAQALAKAQEQEQANSAGRSSSFSTPRQSMSGDASFQSLMNNQNRGYGHNGMQQQQQQNTPTRVMSMQNLQQVGNQFYSTSPMMTPPTSQSFSIQSNVGEMVGQGVPRNMMEAQQQFQMHQQQMQHSGSVRSQSRVSTFQEFSAQIQHLDKSVLIELLWNQRSALARWQNQAKQLELQLSAKQNASSNMGSPGFPSPYNSPMVGGINPNVAAEAEMQRARERGSSRMTPQQQQQMQQYPYGQQSNESSPAYSQAGGSWGDNPQLYWDRIRVLKSAYEDQLRTAQRALAHNTAPPNSIYSVKAQSMMQNIGLVLTILNETPSNVQPRKFEVLNSIERFMQITVTPIVQKVLSSGAMAQSGSASQAMVSGPSSASAANVATYSSPARGNVVEMANSSRQTSDNQYSGTRWASSSSYSGMDTSRRGTFAAEDKSSIDDNGPRMDTPTQMMDGLATAGSNPSTTAEPGYAYEQVGVGNDGQAAGQSENSADQYGAPEIAPKETQTSALPVSESRPSTITEAQLSSGADLSPDGNARDTNTTKMVSVDDTLNDFSDFPVLDFDDPVPEGNSFVKENNPSNVGRKRGVEDV